MSQTLDQVRDVPGKRPWRGIAVYCFRVEHRPTRHAHAHSQVEADECVVTTGLEGPPAHLDRRQIDRMPREVQLEFRELLLRRTAIEIRPGEYEWVG